MKVIEIRCDKCDVLGDDGKNAYVVRQKLARLGWANVGRYDWCPPCTKERAEVLGLRIR